MSGEGGGDIDMSALERMERARDHAGEYLAHARNLNITPAEYRNAIYEVSEDAGRIFDQTMEDGGVSIDRNLGHDDETPEVFEHTYGIPDDPEIEALGDDGL